MLIISVALSLVATTVCAQDFKAELADPAWDGQKVPEAHNCNGTAAATPPLKSSGLPTESGCEKHALYRQLYPALQPVLGALAHRV